MHQEHATVLKFDPLYDKDKSTTQYSQPNMNSAQIFEINLIKIPKSTKNKCNKLILQNV